jgi:uncharacterized protein (TIGR00290 family)
MSKLSFCSWSGGKDSCLALYKAAGHGYEVKYLLTMMSEEGGSRSHGISGGLLREQSEKLGMEMIQRRSSWENYEREFLDALGELKKKGVEHGVFGDIDTQEHLDWVSRACETAGMRYLEPLWKYDRMDVLREFLDAGFRALIVSCDGSRMSEKFLGRELSLELADELSSINVDAAGEYGEFHTFVYDGPLFNKRIEFKAGDVRRNNNYLFLEIE